MLLSLVTAAISTSCIYAYPLAALVAFCSLHLHVALDHWQVCSLIVVQLHMVACLVSLVYLLLLFVLGMVYALGFNLCKVGR